MAVKRGFGRLHKPDDRDKSFHVRELLAGVKEEYPIKSRHWWANGWWGNQGKTSMCVAYSWIHWLEDGPVTHTPRVPGKTLIDPVDVYNHAQSVDEFPGNAYNGTSVRAGAKVMRELGYISSYWWAWDIETAINAILELGPIVVGTNWYSGMSDLDEKGFMSTNGRNLGGHAYVINGVYVDGERFRIKNSWGRRWGKKGFAWMSFSVLEQLIREDGEICLAKEIAS